MENLRNRVALVTGGGSGIGRATAIALARRGARVVIGGRRKDRGEDVAQQIRAEGGEAIFQQADVSSEAAVSALVARAVEAFGRLDFAFNNAGVGHPSLLADLAEEDFCRVFDTNVKGVWLSMKHEIRQMQAQGGGVIVNNSSVHGFRTIFEGTSAYTASKHAVIALTKAAAVEYARVGIRVNAVAPGPIATEMFTASEDLIGGQHVWRDMLPVKRIGAPEEVASVVLWMFSDGASFVTGQTLGVDGGFLAC
jgi:NAD(P)-dependent dehydrogenase (short-subunit alcohol dehydrogenase family)